MKQKKTPQERMYCGHQVTGDALQGPRKGSEAALPAASQSLPSPTSAENECENPSSPGITAPTGSHYRCCPRSQMAHCPAATASGAPHARRVHQLVTVRSGWPRSCRENGNLSSASGWERHIPQGVICPTGERPSESDGKSQV